MSMLPKLVIVDTNVWLDYFVATRPGREAARDLMCLAQEHSINLLYTIGTIKDVSYIAEVAFKADVRADGGVVDETVGAIARQFAWSCVMSMRELATAVGADETDVWVAEKYHAVHPDFEDDLILAAAQRVHADYLITNDRHLAEAAPIAALTPERFNAMVRSFANG